MASRNRSLMSFSEVLAQLADSGSEGTSDNEDGDSISVQGRESDFFTSYAAIEPVPRHLAEVQVTPVIGECMSNAPAEDLSADIPLLMDGTVTVDAPTEAQATESPESLAESIPKEGRSRKRKRDPSKWKANIRKRLCQEGKPYLSIRGKMVNEKTIKTLKNCNTDCKFKCVENISQEDRVQIHDSYYTLDQSRKYDYIVGTTSCGATCRPNTKGSSCRKKSFRYFFTIAEKKIRVCKPYYLGTLCISQKVVYNVHKKKGKVTGTPQADRRGKNAIPEAAVRYVKEHISSFAVVESHYCRAKSNKRYLESHLNVSKMYDLYEEKCKAEGKSPVKLSFYRTVFNSITPALDFHRPKSDRCDRCEEYKSAQNNRTITDDLRASYQAHFAEKEAMRVDRRMDREDKEKLVVSFDLQNVITCPKADISSFFYRRKLNVYNLTGHESVSKTGYCVVWTETTSGRAGNDIASAFIQILERVVLKHKDVKNITTWSDSCVPQNRNSVMAFAVAGFLSRHPNIESVTMKYCTPGHSAVQESDNTHSVLERSMSVAEFYSPVSLLRIMLKSNRKNLYTVIQMRAADFNDYQTCAKALNYKVVPFSKVTLLKFNSANLFEVQYKTSHQTEHVEVKSINPMGRGRQDRELSFETLQAKVLDYISVLSQRILQGKMFPRVSLTLTKV